MKIHLLLLFLIELAVSNALAERVDFGAGIIDLPATTKNISKQGIDSSIGSLVSTDGTPDINYDIGLGPTEIPKINPSDYIFFKTGKLNGFDYYATISKFQPNRLSFFLFKPMLAGFWASVSSEKERETVLRILLRYSPGKTEQDAAANP